jgi:hypothetical protein
MSRDQTTGQNNYTKAANKSFKNVAKFKYLGITITKIPFMRKVRTD